MYNEEVLAEELDTVFRKEFDSDDAYLGSELEKLYYRYKESDKEYKRGVDDALSAVVGWTMPTLVKKAKGKRR